MPYIQIGLIDPENLPPAQRSWVESQLSEKYGHLVYITDGDESLTHEIHMEYETPERVAEEIKNTNNGRRMTVTLIDEDDNKEVLELFRSLLQEGDTETKGYWGGSRSFHFED
jgi:hypothetical protein